MGKLAAWLGSHSTAHKAVADPLYPPAHVAPFDAERVRGFRHALNSRALGQPTQDYLALASHMTGLVHMSVNLLATLVGDSKWSLWERSDSDPDGAVRLRRDDPLMRLYDDPNHIDTAQDFMYQQAQQYELAGMALVWTPPDRDPNEAGAEVAEMWCLPRAGMVLHPPTPDYPQGYWMALPYGMYGNPAYGYYTAGAKIPAEQVMVFKKSHPYFRWEGYSVLSAMAQSITTLEALETARLAAQLQGCEQSVAIEFDKDTLTPKPEQMERIKAQWYAENAGPTNAGKFLFLGGGAKLNKFSATPAEMAWTEGFAQVSEYLLAAFGTPKALVGMVDELNHSTLFGTLKANHLTKLRPLLNRLAARHTKDVLRPFYGRGVFMKLEADAIHDDELLERQLENDMKCGARTVGEIRSVRGLDRTGEAWESERAFAGKGAEPGADKGTAEGQSLDDRRDRDSEGGRPDNPAGAGSLGPRMKSDRAEALLDSMERLKSRGVIGDLTRKVWSNGVGTNGDHT